MSSFEERRALQEALLRSIELSRSNLGTTPPVSSSTPENRSAPPTYTAPGRTPKADLDAAGPLEKIPDTLNTEDKCSICLDEYKPPLWRLSCDHYFHIDCLKGWLEAEKVRAKNRRSPLKCAFCRKEIFRDMVCKFSGEQYEYYDDDDDDDSLSESDLDEEMMDYHHHYSSYPEDGERSYDEDIQSEEESEYGEHIHEDEYISEDVGEEEEGESEPLESSALEEGEITEQNVEEMPDVIEVSEYEGVKAKGRDQANEDIEEGELLTSTASESEEASRYGPNCNH